uniref:Uncharacterized protein n=1 Tax=Takifugu rubripes TaxID=31033 RepID=A0A674NCN6_TAKRU
MPICWVMWSQVPGVPSSCSLAFTSWSLGFSPYHSAKSSGELSVLLTMRAPCEGGLDQVVLTIFSIWDRMRVRFSLSWATTVRLPTLSSDHKDRRGNYFPAPRGCFSTRRTHCKASLSRLPEAKPW